MKYLLLSFIIFSTLFSYSSEKVLIAGQMTRSDLLHGVVQKDWLAIKKHFYETSQGRINLAHPNILVRVLNLHEANYNQPYMSHNGSTLFMSNKIGRTSDTNYYKLSLESLRSESIKETGMIWCSKNKTGRALYNEKMFKGEFDSLNIQEGDQNALEVFSSFTRRCIKTLNLSFNDELYVGITHTHPVMPYEVIEISSGRSLAYYTGELSDQDLTTLVTLGKILKNKFDNINFKFFVESIIPSGKIFRASF